ncbi:MAG: hypothetical protein IMY72_01255 [Bacteroidetes bacterium]|nr:hypothetical protein [Bacteroidota bacterium]
MKKNFLYIISFLFILTAFPSNSMANGDDIFKNKKNVSRKKGNFHKDEKFGTRESKALPLMPPDPSGGDGGYPVPIANGLNILLILSGIYVTRKIKKEIKK